MTGAGVRTGPAPRARARVYYGWSVPGVAALAMVGTLPGRTLRHVLVAALLILTAALAALAVAAAVVPISRGAKAT
jgi:hypothetical protein